MSVLLAIALFAQLFIPQPAYMTADPVTPAHPDDGSPGRLGLATPSGRYMVELEDGCETLDEGMNVEVLVIDDEHVSVSVPDVLVCTVRVIRRMSTTPCFQNPEGNCDYAAEANL